MYWHPSGKIAEQQTNCHSLSLLGSRLPRWIKVVSDNNLFKLVQTGWPNKIQTGKLMQTESGDKPISTNARE
jgi:hypothetical protein